VAAAADAGRRHRDGNDRIRLDIAQLRPCAAVDRTGRQMRDQVDDARNIVAAEQAAIEPLTFEPMPGRLVIAANRG